MGNAKPFIKQVTLPSGTTYLIKDDASFEALKAILGEPTWDSTNDVYRFDPTKLSHLQAVTNITNNQYITNINEAATHETTHAAGDIGSATSESTKLPDVYAVQQYVNQQVGEIHNFDVVIDRAGTASGPSLDNIEANMYKLVLVPEAAPDQAAGDFIEWILIRSGEGSETTYTWEQIGSTKTDLSGYLTTSTKIADITIGNDAEIGKQELKDALGLGNLNLNEVVESSKLPQDGHLGDLAYKDSAQGTIAANTFVTGVTVQGSEYDHVTGASLTTSGPTTASVTGKYVKANSISGQGDLLTGGSINVTLKDASASTAADLTSVPVTYVKGGSVSGEFEKVTGAALQSSVNGTQLLTGGSVAAPEVTVTLSTATVSHVTDAGTAYTLTNGSVTKAADTKSSFAKKVMDATVGNDETLVFNWKGEEEYSQAGSEAEYDVFEQAVTAAGGVTYTAPTLSGSLPTFEDVNAATGVSSATASAPTFTPQTDKFGIALTTATAAISNTNFVPTNDTFDNVTAVKYLKQEVDAKTFTPVQAANLTLATSEESITGGSVSVNIPDGIDLAIATATHTVTLTVTKNDATTVTVQ